MRATLTVCRPRGAQLRRGHIPGAVSHFWQGDLVKVDFATMWKARDELRASYVAQGITSRQSDHRLL